MTVPQLPGNSDLPLITLDIGLGRSKKTRVNFYYREWTSGISGDSSHPAQLERLTRIVNHWETLQGPANQLRDVVLLGDTNLCSLSWNNPDYPAQNKELADIIKEFFINESFAQLVSVFTRSQKSANGEVSRSCLDHISTNISNKCSVPTVTSAGDSDHLSTLNTKYSRELRVDHKTTKNAIIKTLIW